MRDFHWNFSKVDNASSLSLSHTHTHPISHILLSHIDFIIGVTKTRLLRILLKDKDPLTAFAELKDKTKLIEKRANMAKRKRRGNALSRVSAPKRRRRHRSASRKRGKSVKSFTATGGAAIRRRSRSARGRRKGVRRKRRASRVGRKPKARRSSSRRRRRASSRRSSHRRGKAPLGGKEKGGRGTVMPTPQSSGIYKTRSPLQLTEFRDLIRDQQRIV